MLGHTSEGFAWPPGGRHAGSLVGGHATPPVGGHAGPTYGLSWQMGEHSWATFGGHAAAPSVGHAGPFGARNVESECMSVHTF
jgi:hypothetical protein